MSKHLLLALLLLATPSALVAGNFDLGEFYFGAGQGADGEAGAFRAGLESFAGSDGDPTKIFAGIGIGRYLAVEAARYDFATQTCCTQIADLGFRSQVDGLSLGVAGRFPMRFATPFAKAGLLSWEEDGEFITLLGPSAESRDGEDLFVGAGIEVRLIGLLGLRLEWERYEFDDAESESFWASVLVRFGRL